jgi:excisionase family DNA binding protein
MTNTISVQELLESRLAVGICEASELLPLHKSTIRNYIKRGLIRHSRIGRIILIPVTEINRLVNETS